MTCDVLDLIEKHRQYVIGWLRIYETRSNTTTAAEMGQYSLDLLKLRNSHVKRCVWCKQTSRQKN